MIIFMRKLIKDSRLISNNVSKNAVIIYSSEMLLWFLTCYFLAKKFQIKNKWKRRLRAINAWGMALRMSMNLKLLLIQRTFSNFTWPQILYLQPTRDQWVIWRIPSTFLLSICNMRASIGFTCQYTSCNNCLYSPSKLSIKIDEVSTSASKILLLLASSIHKYAIH
jgi:hypothetical protein